MAFIRIAIVTCWLIQCMGLETRPNKHELQVDGNEFVSINLRERPPVFAMKKHTLWFEFKTMEQHGMLVYIGSRRALKDFLMLDMVHGKLRVTVNLGDRIPSPSGHLVLEEPLADNRWHNVNLSLVGKELNVTHGEQTHRVLLQSKYAGFDVTGFVYVGGLLERTRNVLRGYKPSPNLRGCLGNVFFDNWQVLLRPTEADKYYRVYGSPAPNCSRGEFQTLSFQHPDSSLYLPSTGQDLFNVQLRFRTYLPNSLQIVKTGSGLLVKVTIKGGKIMLNIQLALVARLPTFTLGKNLNDGEWHGLSVVITRTEIKMKLDQLQELRQALGLNVTSQSHQLFITQFVGCLQDLRIDGHVVELRNIPHHAIRKVTDRCNISTSCFPNPCLHGGKCSDLRSGGFSCDCADTFYRGPLCERRVYLKSCQEYKNLGLTDDAYCKVHPSGSTKPLEVLCNMTGQDQAVTLVLHNQVGYKRISSAAGVYHTHLFYLFYGPPITDIQRLIEESETCRQFVSFKCFASKLLGSPVGAGTVTWLGGDREAVTDYWPGAPAGSMKCACGVNGTCADPTLACNCDMGDETWREDKGYLTDKKTLPMVALQFSRSAAQSYFTVGPLECSGTALNNDSQLPLQVQRDVWRFVKSSCRPVNPTTPEPSSPAPRHTERDTEPTTWKVREEITLPPRKLPTTGQSAKPEPGPSSPSPNNAERPLEPPASDTSLPRIAAIVVITFVSACCMAFMIFLCFVCIKNR